MLKGKILCFTGTLSLKRDVATAMATGAGATVTGSVSGKTNILVAGPGAGSKMAEAQSKGVEVWTEEQFIQAVQGGGKKSAPVASAAAPAAAAPVPRPAAAPAAAAGGSLKGKILCFTGTLSLKRDVATAMATGAGATVTGSVSGKTNILVAGPGAGSKMAEAQSKGVEVWTEEQFIQAVQGGGAGPAVAAAAAGGGRSRKAPRDDDEEEEDDAPKAKKGGKPSAGGAALAGKVIVFTGTLSESRGSMEAKAKAAGASVASAISGKTTLVVAGENAGSKLAAAEERGIEVWDEDKFNAVLNGEDPDEGGEEGGEEGEEGGESIFEQVPDNSVGTFRITSDVVCIGAEANTVEALMAWKLGKPSTWPGAEDMLLPVLRGTWHVANCHGGESDSAWGCVFWHDSLGSTAADAAKIVRLLDDNDGHPMGMGGHDKAKAMGVEIIEAMSWGNCERENPHWEAAEAKGWVPPKFPNQDMIDEGSCCRGSGPVCFFVPPDVFERKVLPVMMNEEAPGPEGGANLIQGGEGAMCDIPEAEGEMYASIWFDKTGPNAAAPKAKCLVYVTQECCSVDFINTSVAGAPVYPERAQNVERMREVAKKHPFFAAFKHATHKWDDPEMWQLLKLNAAADRFVASQISGCSQELTGQLNFAEIPPELTSFSMQHTTKMTPQVFFVNQMPRGLTYLSLVGCPNLKGNFNAAHLPNTLTWLNLVDCKSFTGIFDFAALPPLLENLEVTGNAFTGEFYLTKTRTTALPRSLTMFKINDNEFTGTVDRTLIPSTIGMFQIANNHFEIIGGVAPSAGGKVGAKRSRSADDGAGDAVDESAEHSPRRLLPQKAH